MSTKLIIGIVVALIIIAGAFFLLRNNAEAPQAPAPEEETVSPNEGDEMSNGTEEDVPTVREFTVFGDEFSFSTPVLTVNRGDQVRLTFRNNGDAPHNWAVEGLNVRTDTIAGGESDTIEFTADQSGRFTIYCGVPGHRDRGMVGTLVVE